MSSEVTVKVVLHGYLKKLHPEGELRLSGYCAAEILSGLLRALPALKQIPGAAQRLVQFAGFKVEEEFFVPLKTEVIHAVPAMLGGKGFGGVFKIILGVVLIAATFAFPVLGTIALVPSLGITLGSMMFNFGLSLVLGGLMEMLSPAPSNAGGGAKEPTSNYFAATQNTTKIGTRIALFYGRMKIYGQILSYNVDAKDVKV